MAHSAFVLSTVSRSTCSGCSKVEEVCVQPLRAASAIHNAAVANCVTSSCSAPTTGRNEVRHAGDEVVRPLRRATIGSLSTVSRCERASSQRVVPAFESAATRGHRGTRYDFYLGRSLQASPCNRSSKNPFTHLAPTPATGLNGLKKACGTAEESIAFFSRAAEEGQGDLG